MSYPINNQQQIKPQCQPVASCGAVSINIMNPTVGAMPPVNSYQNGIYQYPEASYYSNQPTSMPYPQNYNMNMTNPYQMSTNLNAAANATPPAPVPVAPDVKKDAVTNENSDTKEVTKKKVQLTDDYIKNLENYLNSNDSKIRLMAAKELLERYKEDKNRASDPALTALLNKTLQDPTAAVRFLALTTLDAGYANGNDETIQILKNIQGDTQSEYGEDSLLASQILLKLSAGDKVEYKEQVPANEAEANTTEKETK